MQAKSTSVTLRGNIAYNAPRALINFNDEFGGGHLVTQNLLFNAVRETGDNGDTSKSLQLSASGCVMFLCVFLISDVCVSRLITGAFNSIPRMPQMTTNRDPEHKIASYYPAWSNLTRNFIIANYHSDDGMDHDGASGPPPLSFETTVTRRHFKNNRVCLPRKT